MTVLNWDEPFSFGHNINNDADEDDNDKNFKYDDLVSLVLQNTKNSRVNTSALKMYYWVNKAVQKESIVKITLTIHKTYRIPLSRANY